MPSPPRILLSAHGALELLAGLALVVAAFALDLGGAGLVVTFVAGVAPPASASPPSTHSPCTSTRRSTPSW